MLHYLDDFYKKNNKEFFMDLMTAVMFLVGLAAGGGGAFFFTKKSTVVDTPTTPKPVASHEKNTVKLDKLKKEIATLTQKHSADKKHLEEEVVQLKKLEGELKDQLSSLANAQKQPQVKDFSEELNQAKAKIEEKERTIANLENSEKAIKEQVSQLQKQLSNGQQDVQAHIQQLENDSKKVSSVLIDKENLIAELNRKIAELSSAQHTAPAASSSSLKAIGERRLLVVDDSKVVRNKLSNTLKKAGYQVELAEDGRDALNKLQADNNFDLVVTDLEMPNLDGHQLITEIHTNEKLKVIPVMAITGHEEITLNVVHNEGLVGVHKKPWSDEELLKKISGLSLLKG